MFVCVFVRVCELVWVVCVQCVSTGHVGVRTFVCEHYVCGGVEERSRFHV